MLVKAFIFNRYQERQGEPFEFHSPIAPLLGSNIHLAVDDWDYMLYTVVSHPTFVLRRSHNGGKFSHNELAVYEINVQEA